MFDAYTLMHKDISVADLNLVNGHIVEVTKVITPEHLPVCSLNLKNNELLNSLDKWWECRRIPASRQNLHSGLLNLGINDITFPKDLLLKSLGLSLSDHYWLRPYKSRFKWDNVNFYQNPFSDDIGEALFDNLLQAKPDFMSPDNTSDGNLKKKWKILNNKRFLLKEGTHGNIQQAYNEVIATYICKQLQFSRYVEYFMLDEYKGNVCACENFTDVDTEFVTAYHFLVANGFQCTESNKGFANAYQFYVNACKNCGVYDIQERLDEMLLLDYLLLNTDRHWRNFGLLRNSDSLKYLAVAPIFDTGSCLGYSAHLPEDLLDLARSNPEVPPFMLPIEEHLNLITDIRRFDLSKLDTFGDSIYQLFSSAKGFSEEWAYGLRTFFNIRLEMLKKRLAHCKRTQVFLLA